MLSSRKQKIVQSHVRLKIAQAAVFGENFPRLRRTCSAQFAQNPVRVFENLHCIIIVPIQYGIDIWTLHSYCIFSHLNAFTLLYRPKFESE